MTLNLRPGSRAGYHGAGYHGASYHWAGYRWAAFRGARRPMTARRAVTGAAVAVLAAGGITATIAARPGPRVPGLLMQGIAADPCVPGRVLAIPAGLPGRYVPGSSVLRTPDGVLTAGGVTPLTGALAGCAARAEAASRAWLRAGAIPGSTPAQRSMARRALLDLRLSVRPDGAVAAAWHGQWRYDWPRDSSWVAAALAGTGHLTTALRVLEFLATVQPASGIWAARYHLDGAPVADGRPAELDATGWVPWAVWAWAQAAGSGPGALPAAQILAGLSRLWPMVTRAADAAAGSLASDGLPEPAMDYWEDSVQATLGTAAPLLAGLRAAADLAGLLGDAAHEHRWANAAARLGTAVTKLFAGSGYQRTPALTSGADAAIAFLGPPFATADAAVLRAAAKAQAVLRVQNGGLLPGDSWTGSLDEAWTAETAFFALFDAGTGQGAAAARWLSWLQAHRTAVGELAEQVNAEGRPVSVAPLAWTDALVLLAELAEDGHLPTVGVPVAPSR